MVFTASSKELKRRKKQLWRERYKQQKCDEVYGDKKERKEVARYRDDVKI